MFSKKCFCKGNIAKIVRPPLAALSVNGLNLGTAGKRFLPNYSEQCYFPPGVTGLNVKCFACVDKVCEPYVHSSILLTILSAIYIINIQTAKLRSWVFVGLFIMHYLLLLLSN